MSDPLCVHAASSRSSRQAQISRVMSPPRTFFFSGFKTECPLVPFLTFNPCNAISQFLFESWAYTSLGDAGYHDHVNASKPSMDPDLVTLGTRIFLSYFFYCFDSDHSWVMLHRSKQLPPPDLGVSFLRPAGTGGEDFT